MDLQHSKKSNVIVIPNKRSQFVMMRKDVMGKDAINKNGCMKHIYNHDPIRSSHQFNSREFTRTILPSIEPASSENTVIKTIKPILPVLDFY